MKLKLLLPLLASLLGQSLQAAPAVPEVEGQAHGGSGQEPNRPAPVRGTPSSEAPASAPQPQASVAAPGAAPAGQPLAAPAPETASLDPERGWFLAARISLLH